MRVLHNLGVLLLLALVAAGIIAFGAISAVFVAFAAVWDFATDKVWPSLSETISSGWESTRK